MVDSSIIATIFPMFKQCVALRQDAAVQIWIIIKIKPELKLVKDHWHVLARK